MHRLCFPLPKFIFYTRHIRVTPMASRHLHAPDRARAGLAALQAPATLVRLHKLLVAEPIKLVPGALAAVTTRQKLQWVACTDFEVDDGVKVEVVIGVVVVACAFEASKIAAGCKKSRGVKGAGDELYGQVVAGWKVRVDLLHELDWKNRSRVDSDRGVVGENLQGECQQNDFR